MAKRINTQNLLMPLVWTVIVVWFCLLTFQGSMFGQLGLGLILLVGGIWQLARAPQIWNDYLKAYKKVPAAQRSSWNAPRRRYYYLNTVILLPAAIALGFCLILLTYLASR